MITHRQGRIQSGAVGSSPVDRAKGSPGPLLGGLYSCSFSGFPSLPRLNRLVRKVVHHLECCQSPPLPPPCVPASQHRRPF